MGRAWRVWVWSCGAATAGCVCCSTQPFNNKVHLQQNKRKTTRRIHRISHRYTLNPSIEIQAGFFVFPFKLARLVRGGHRGRLSQAVLMLMSHIDVCEYEPDQGGGECPMTLILSWYYLDPASRRPFHTHFRIPGLQSAQVPARPEAPHVHTGLHLVCYEYIYRDTKHGVCVFCT